MKMEGMRKGGEKKEVKKMGWLTIVALVVMVPVILIPIALVWYINIGGIVVAIKKARGKRAARNAHRTIDA